MKKIKTWATFLVLLLQLSVHGQNALKSNEATQPEKNAVRFTTISDFPVSFSFKFNYERNLKPKLIGFASIEGEINFMKSIGLGLKYKILNSNNFEGLLGLEFQRSLTSFSSSCYCKNPIYNINPTLELRYYFYHSFMLVFEISDPYILKRANLQDKLPGSISLGVGFRI